MSVVVLSGGSGGAKLARGISGAIGEELTVIANTGDDIEIYGGYVSPDPDLVTYWLADRIDERGWGLRDDTWAVMEGIRELGGPSWFNLGDRDLAVCIERARLLAQGATLTEALAHLVNAFGVRARVLPMCDEPVRTTIRSGEAELGIQEFLIRERGEAPIDEIEYRGVADAAPVAAALAAIEAAEVILVGPSNPVLSIGPILAVPGIRDALDLAAAPVVAVSPVVGGEILKGPTAACLEWAGQTCSAQGVVNFYDGLLDGIVADEPVDGIPLLEIDTLMDTVERRRTVAAQVVAFGQSLARAG